MEPKFIEVKFLPSGKHKKFLAGTSILEAALSLGVNITSICGGKGACGKCRIMLKVGINGANSLTSQELKQLSEEEI